MKKKCIIFNKEQRLIHHLLLDVSALKDLGLLNGKMGIVIFLFHYAQYTSNRIYKEIAEELLDEVWQEITSSISIDFKSGLSGIGWGIEYLIQYKFVKADSLEVCKELDQKIMIHDPRRIKDLTLENGLQGLLSYVLVHVKNNMSKGVVFDKIYLNDLYISVKNINNCKNEDLRMLIDEYVKYCLYNKEPNIQLNILPLLKGPKINLKKDTIEYPPLGLNNGIAGYLISKILSK